MLYSSVAEVSSSLEQNPSVREERELRKEEAKRFIISKCKRRRKEGRKEGGNKARLRRRRWRRKWRK